ncbi:MAG: YSC84-related protein [Phycisphaeraceae bacterium]
MKNHLFALTLAVLGFALTACTTTPNSPAERQSLVTSAAETTEIFLRNDPSLQELIDDSYAYAVFPSIGRGGAGIGGAYGRGIVYERGQHVGYCDVTQATVGFQLGGQAFRQLIFFRDESALRRFKHDDLHLSAQATAVAATAGASADADYERGVMVFTLARGGLMYEASIGGQRFTYQPK